MNKICKERCIVVNYNEHDNLDMFVVFMLPGNGLFLRGLLKAELRTNAVEIARFYWADIEFIDSDDEDAMLEIVSLKMNEQAETCPPAF